MKRALVLSHRSNMVMQKQIKCFDDRRHTSEKSIRAHVRKQQFSAIFDEKIEVRERCKGVHCVDLGESFQTYIYLQNVASIQPRTSRFCRPQHFTPPGNKFRSEKL